MSNENELILTGRHIELTDALKEFVEEKADKLFRHEERIIRIRFELDIDKNHHKDRPFIAKGIIEINGPQMVVTEATHDMHKSIDEVVNKLDRKIRRRCRMERVKRKHPHEVELDAQLPKVSPA
ncbi:MAG: ribosome-associated translation inhibitor RaiA [Opitutales bacterium]|nr:ribosome-associated translation inhibitor RaiA [Opitutales bacterium]